MNIERVIAGLLVVSIPAMLMIGISTLNAISDLRYSDRNPRRVIIYTVLFVAWWAGLIWLVLRR